MKKKEIIKKELQKTINKEKKILKKNMHVILGDQALRTANRINNQLPFDAKEKFNDAFKKGFITTFNKGIKYIEKTYQKEKLMTRYFEDTHQFKKQVKKRNLRKIDRRVYRKGLLNTGISTLEGAAVGFMGLTTALADVPVFISIILKHLNETALHYGFNYEYEDEKIFMLKLLDMSVTEGETRFLISKEIDKIGYGIDIGVSNQLDIKETIENTSEYLAEFITVSKLMQSIPVAGSILGGLNNYQFMRSIINVANVKYKKRYLYKMMANSQQDI